MIEANPESFNQMVGNRPAAYRMNFSPTCSTQDGSTVPFYAYPLPNVGLVERATIYEGKPTVDIRCGPLGPVLEDVFNGQSINFLSLDVETAEALVLETIDFEKVHIDVLIVGTKHTHCRLRCDKFRDASRAVMAKTGYKRYENVIVHSDLYVRPGSNFPLDGKGTGND